eukprot:4013415-Heterocapsa_arctica.AAC.1
MASAAFWWSRIAEAVRVRGLHYIIGPKTRLELLRFLDNLIRVGGTKDKLRAIGFVICFSLILGGP